MLRIIEALDATSTVMVEGRTCPAIALLEDDDGRRWLLHHDATAFQPALWLKAAASGVTGIVVPAQQGYLWMSSETFLADRTEALGSYVTTSTSWRFSVAFPTARDLVLGPALTPVRSGFVHLHTHSEFSSWDGYATVQEAVAAAVADDQGALGFTDHGNCAVHPEQAKICKKAGIKPVFGTEAYFVDDRFARDKATERYHHLILLAQNDTGLRNLWAASTEAYRDGFYGKPRLDWSTLERHREGVIASTGCLSGPVAAAVLQGNEPLAKARLGRLLEIFGDRLYMEIHTNGLEEQHLVNHVLVDLAQAHGVPLLAVTDSHFAAQAQAPQHRAWMQCATSSEVTDDAEVFGFNADSWLLSEADARKALSYLPDHVVSEAMGNTVAIAESCTAALATTSATPTFSKASVEHPDPVLSDEQRLLDLCMESWERKTTDKGYTQEVALARFEHEFPMLVRKGFCGYFLMVADYCRAAKEGRIDGHADGVLTGKPILVGPGRGSGGGSLVAYLSGITGVDPIEGGLLFERFMTEGRTALPDFDVDFPASKKRHLLSYVRERWGQDYVATVGSHLRLKNKGIVRDLGRTMKDALPESAFLDLNKVSNIIDEAEAGTAGLGLTWEELWAQEGDRLDPYRERYPDLFAMADHLVGRLKTYGKHAAGVVISTDSPLTGSLPLRKATDDDMDEGLLVTQFEKNALEDLGLVKFDLLTIRTLDTIQMCLDLIESQRGLRINVEDWKQEYTDPLVWEQIAAAHTLGIFQIETVSGTRLIKRMKPGSIAELADAITLVRPGPMRSGLTEMYLRRRNGDEPVTYPDPRMEQVLAKTFGTLLYQEDIMAACMVLAGYDSVQADEVRSILGKKKVEKIPAAGEQFVSGCVERGMSEQPARMLWAQMAEFAKYSFNRAHAYAYAVIGYWCAWLKFHYPVQFLTAALSTVDKDRIPDFIAEARRMGYAVQPPDINLSGVGFTGSALEVRYGLDSLKGINQAASHIAAAAPFTSYEDFLTRVVKIEKSKVNMGHVATLARIGAFDSLVPNRRALEAQILGEKTGEASRCVHQDDLVPLEVRPQNRVVEGKWGQPLPCTFDWSSEPVRLGRTGKPLKAQPQVAMKCFKGCRNYQSIPPLDPANVEPYTVRDIRNIEHELLGVYLSSTPFDDLDDETREITRSCAESIETAGAEGALVLSAIVTRVKGHRDKNNNAMAFLTLQTEAGIFDASVLSTQHAEFGHLLKEGVFAILEVNKNSRGMNVIASKII